MRKSLSRASNRVRIAIAWPFNVLALSHSMSPSYDDKSKRVRLAEWVNTHILPDNLD